MKVPNKMMLLLVVFAVIGQGLEEETDGQDEKVCDGDPEGMSVEDEIVETVEQDIDAPDIGNNTEQPPAFQSKDVIQEYLKSSLQRFLESYLPMLASILVGSRVFEFSGKILIKVLNTVIDGIPKYDYLQHAAMNAPQNHATPDGLLWDERHLIDVLVPKIYNLILCHEMLESLYKILETMAFREEFRPLYRPTAFVLNTIQSIEARPHDSGLSLLLNDRVRVLVESAQMILIRRLQSDAMSTKTAAVYDTLIGQMEAWLNERNNMYNVMETIMRDEILSGWAVASQSVGAPDANDEELVRGLMQDLITGAFTMEWNDSGL